MSLARDITSAMVCEWDMGAEMYYEPKQPAAESEINRSHTRSGLVSFFQAVYAQQMDADCPFLFRSSGLEKDLPVVTKDTLAGKHGEYVIVLASPPFGKKSSVTISILNQPG